MMAQKLSETTRASRSFRGGELVTLSVRLPDGRLGKTSIRRSELVRRAMAAEIARKTVWLAQEVHVTESGRRISLDRQWESIYADPSCDMRIIAPAQRGKTLYQIVKTMAQLYCGMAVGWVMPKYGKVQELVNGKLNGTIKNTPLYLEMQEASTGADTLQFKTFGDYGKLYLVTANSENELTSFSSDAMHIDERDFCNRVNLPMYPSRMNASPYRLTDEISTPTTEGSEAKLGQPGNDNIHSEWLTGDRRRYFSKCPRCGTEQILDWYKNVVQVDRDESGRITGFDVRDKDWSVGSPQDLRVCCRECRHPFDRLSSGRWIAQRPHRTRMRTYWVEALASPIGPSIEQMLQTFTRALGNPSKMQHFHNMDLGRPYAGGMLRFTKDLFRQCAPNQRHWMLTECDGPCTAGVDVNRPWLDIQISRWIGGKQVKVWAGKVQGGEREVVALFRKFNVIGAVIDNQPETKFSMSLQDACAGAGISMIRCKYASTEQSRMIVVSEAGENPKLDPPRLITVNRTVAIDTLYETMQTKVVEWFTDWETAISGALIEEFTIPVRKLSISEAGAERFVWEGKPDHQLHAAVYDLLAGDLLKMNIVRDYSEIGPFVNDFTHGGGGYKPDPGGNPQRNDAVMIQRG